MEMGSMRKLTAVVIMVVLIASAVLGARLIAPVEEDRAMDLTNGSIVSSMTIPRIDASAPQKTETATFALG